MRKGVDHKTRLRSAAQKNGGAVHVEGVLWVCVASSGAHHRAVRRIEEVEVDDQAANSEPSRVRSLMRQLAQSQEFASFWEAGFVLLLDGRSPNGEGFLLVGPRS